MISDSSFYSCNSCLKLFSSSKLILKSTILSLKLCLRFTCLLFVIFIGYTNLCDRIMHTLQSSFSTLNFLIFLFLFCNQFAVIFLCLIKSFLKASVRRLNASHFFFKIFQSTNLFIQKGRKMLTIILKSLSLFLEAFNCNTKSSIFIITALIFVLNFFYLISYILYFVRAIVTLTFNICVFSQKFLDNQVRFLKLNSQIINLSSKIKDIFLIDIELHSM